jgi:hypothetical protein
MRLPGVRFTVRRLMVAVAAFALVIALGSYLLRVGTKEPVPTDAVEALACAARCAKEREPDFRLDEYDAKVTRLRPGPLSGIFFVSFV